VREQLVAAQRRVGDDLVERLDEGLLIQRGQHVEVDVPRLGHEPAEALRVEA